MSALEKEEKEEKETEEKKDKSVQEFVARWSRRKLESAEHPAGDAPDGPETGRQGVPTAVEPANAAAAPSPDHDAVPAFDLASLPPIESIDAATDVRAFFAPGVPAELKRAALRRAWIADPTIRDFIGIAENQWDFNKPDGVPGFGPLQASKELGRIVAALFGDAAPEADAVEAQTARALENCAAPAVPTANDAAAPHPDTAPPAAVREIVPHTPDNEPSASEANAAPQDNPPQVESIQPPARKHGGALPK